MQIFKSTINTPKVKVVVRILMILVIMLFIFSFVQSKTPFESAPKRGFDPDAKPQYITGEKSDEEIKKSATSTQSSKPSFNSSITDTDRAYLRSKGLLSDPNERIIKIHSSPNDSEYINQWALERMSAPAAWDTTVGSPIIVAVIDTGVSTTHPELAGKVVGGYDFIDNDSIADPYDANGQFQDHGTAVASEIAANTNNRAGMAGISWNARIMPIRSLGVTGSGTATTILSGIRYAADNGANIINMSIGGLGACDETTQSAINYAVSKNIVVIASAGNDNSGVSWPGNCDNVITVAASDFDDNKASFSNFGPQVDVAAPGVSILLSVINPQNRTAPDLGSYSGTSMSAPQVAGQVALMRTIRPSMSVGQVTDIVRRTADKVPAMGGANFTNQFGFGRININRALLECLN